MHVVLDGGPFDAAVRQALDEHLVACAPCRASFDELREVQRSLRELRPAPLPDDALAEVFARTKTLRPRSRGWLDWRVAAAAAALVLVAWGAWSLRSDFGADPAAQGGVGSVATTDPQQADTFTPEERDQAIREARLSLKLVADALKRAERVGVRRVEEVLSEDVSPALERVPVQLPPARPHGGGSHT